MELSEKCINCANRYGSTCRALEESACGQPDCTFYIDKIAFDNKQYKLNMRLAALPEAQQQYIAYKYYDGQRPWNEV